MLVIMDSILSRAGFDCGLCSCIIIMDLTLVRGCINCVLRLCMVVCHEFDVN